jgi:hypothetical protein
MRTLPRFQQRASPLSARSAQYTRLIPVSREDWLILVFALTRDLSLA